jgi:hypothetical protein
MVGLGVKEGDWRERIFRERDYISVQVRLLFARSGDGRGNAWVRGYNARQLAKHSMTKSNTHAAQLGAA